jgi:hypothetical protein
MPGFSPVTSCRQPNELLQWNCARTDERPQPSVSGDIAGSVSRGCASTYMSRTSMGPRRTSQRGSHGSRGGGAQAAPPPVDIPAGPGR